MLRQFIRMKCMCSESNKRIYHIQKMPLTCSSTPHIYQVNHLWYWIMHDAAWNRNLKKEHITLMNIIRLIAFWVHVITCCKSNQIKTHVLSQTKDFGMRVCLLPELENCPPLLTVCVFGHGFKSVWQTMWPGWFTVCWSELLVLVSHLFASVLLVLTHVATCLLNM